ncbi:DUF3320 domain-containing protein [Paracoccus aminophilus]|uniref:DNA helicase n=1 Tax=Paracoccus aminophilus JCM 7686 TaxID=1367847 RepID=S5YUC0_PARAH|nr:DUF3320 domain-containing protein [Paracoccus aminophilus]AGT08841.1 DNA helicase [Paracoccus aminophilus JCM 7686]
MQDLTVDTDSVRDSAVPASDAETDAVTGAATEAETPARLMLEVSAATKVNFATAQNDVAVVKAITITNPLDHAVSGLKLTLSAAPAILREKSWTIDRIAAGGSVTLPNLDTTLDPVILGGLDEAETGQLRFHLEGDGLEDVTLTLPVEMLARDEWGGLAEMDTVLAAFVSPNQPYVARILKEAARLLEAAGHSGAIDGYQSDDPGRVWMLAGAIWSAVTAHGLTYAVPPASFEQVGQKVRMPERIAAEGLATCLDTSLLLAAAFEAAGLNTALLFSQGHAWTGVWLVKRDFGQLVEPDVIELRKAVVAREFVPIETTLLTHRPSAGFEDAVALGRDRLGEAHETEFLQAVDINRARAARIRPLASHQTAGETPVDEVAAVAAALPKPLDFGLLPGERIEAEPDTALGRIERWQRKLLDLSLGNKLLNFKDARSTIPLICPDLAGVEDQLAEGTEFRLLALRDEQATAGRDLSPAEARQIELGVAEEALARKQLSVPLTATEMSGRLTDLFRKARLDMAEGGTNTLFLAMGFLRWKRTDRDPRSYRAPVLLIPVRLDRRSAQSEFRLSLFEDEVRVNFTLLEMLKRDFELRLPELEGELPRDQSGLDIPRILDLLRQRVRDVAGFEVVEEAALSTFSFAKYLMWKDLVDRTDSLRENPMVAHLVDNPDQAFAEAAEPMPAPRDIDQKHSPGDFLAPLPADSSQLAAVAAAAAGRNFVLIGPPGTGKSQTITNIIADQLGRGRTVLFVAEKSAALDVVHRRLSQLGLGAAVLELHSNKADRKKVLQQLDRSWARASSQDAQDWIRVSDDLHLTRDQLNAYVEALHRKGTQGFSVYAAVGRAIQTAPPFTLSFANKDCHDPQAWAALATLAENLGALHNRIADLDPNGPISLLDRGEWSFGWQDRFTAASAKLEATTLGRAQARQTVATALGMAAEPVTEAIAAALTRLARARSEGDEIPPLALAQLTSLREALPALEAALAEAKSARGQLKADYADELLADIPVESLDLQWREAQGKIWPFAGMAQSKLRKMLQTYARSGQADPASDLAALKRLIRARAEIKAAPFVGLPGFDGEASDLAAMRAHLSNAADYLALESDLIAAGLPASLSAARDELTKAHAGRHGPGLLALLGAAAKEEEARAEFEALGGRVSPEAAAYLPALVALAPRFPDWLKWRSAREHALASGLAPLVEALDRGARVPNTRQAFEDAYLRWWLPLAMDAAPPLRAFAQWQHEALIAKFRELDAEQAKLAAQEALRRLGNDLPQKDSVPRKSELGGLRHQIGLERPSKALRALISEMPTTFGKLAPCVLMSPLSVAQYLPAGQAQFDLVIFDEASQISTWDAIGAIARGKQAIIVGDPKQMPPSNFFGRADQSDEADEDLALYEKDMPSILDEVAVAGIPTHRLNWHYRSRDEALIAFSNHFYYDGGLVTFPAPGAEAQAVQMYPVKGTYLRGKGRTNPEEARAITAFICARLRAWLELDVAKRPTLGVITFNQPQQALIQDLLDAELQKDERLEWFFSDDRDEPLIVKNLENIQGDERDIMLFSITYGPDHAGKIPMSFGALNGQGGEKRLNVAVTRARAELHIFSSIAAEQIDLSRTRSRGVADFKAFLDYAKRGAVALGGQDRGSLGGVDSPFEEAVMEALRIKGWDIRTQIGVSDYRIDLGVRHPDHAGAWLAGVECDGARYHGSATARDRDRVRQAVLEGLGWNILRIWSTEWFRAPQATLEIIDQSLHKLLDADRARRLTEAAKHAQASAEASELESEPAMQAEPEAADHDAMPEIHLVEAAEPVDAAPDAPEEAATETPVPPVPHPQFADAARPASEGVSESVSEAAPTQSKPRPALDPDRFFEESYGPVLVQLMADLLAEQAPVTADNLAKQVTQAHGWQRTGGRIRARIDQLLPAFAQSDEAGTAFVWPTSGPQARVPFRGMADRTARDISRHEIASLLDRIGVEVAQSEDPALELARQMGIARLSKDTRLYLEACLNWHS